MLQAVVPSGRHLIELHYWPAAFSAGLALAAAALAFFVIAFLVVILRARRREGQ
jgi:hypothetical protein